MFRPILCALTACAVSLLVAGCGKKSTSAPDWERAGFITNVPSDAEGFLCLHRPAPRWHETPAAWQGLLADPAVAGAWRSTPWGSILDAFLSAPQTEPLVRAAAASADEEVFVVLGRGTAAQLAAAQQVKRLFEAARIRNFFTPPPAAGAAPPETVPPESEPEELEEAAFTEVIVPLPPVMESALQKFVKDAAVPPILIGAKLAQEDAALPSLVAGWAANLPAKIPREKFQHGRHGEFTRVRLPVSLLVPRAAAVRARDILATRIGDPRTATLIIRDLLAKTVVVSFGRTQGYFLVALASDDTPPALAENFEQSLAATPAFAQLPAAAREQPAALVYADALVTGLAAAPPPVGEYLDAALEAALEFAPAARIDPLRTAAESLRQQAAELFKPRVAAISGAVTQTGNVWRAEFFGGSFAPRLAGENSRPLFDPATPCALLWTEQWQDGYTGRLLRFAAGMADFSADWLETLGPVFLDPQALARAKALLAAAGLPAPGLAGMDATEWDRAFDGKRGLAVGLDGVMPPPPLLPASAGKALLPRVAAVAGLRDRAALGRAWERLNTALQGNGGRWWTESLPDALPDGGASYDHPFPLAGPDLGLSVTLAGQRWILGTSGSFNRSIAALPQPAGDTPESVQAIRLRTAPVAEFANVWADALAEDPSLAGFTAGIIPRDPQALRAVAAALREPRRFSYVAKWQRDILHRVFELSPEP